VEFLQVQTPRQRSMLKNGTCGLSRLVLGVNGWVQWNWSRAMLPLIRHQYSNHCQSWSLPIFFSKSKKVQFQNTAKYPKTSQKNGFGGLHPLGG